MGWREIYCRNSESCKSGFRLALRIHRRLAEQYYYGEFLILLSERATLLNIILDRKHSQAIKMLLVLVLRELFLSEELPARNTIKRSVIIVKVIHAS